MAEFSYVPNAPYADCGPALRETIVRMLPMPVNPKGLWDSIMPTMQTRANLFVFLAELRDVVRMFKLIPIKHLRVRSRLAKGLKEFSSYDKPVKDWRSALKYGNDLHLNYNFGWKPFLRDVINTFEGVSSFDGRLQKFVARQNMDLSRKRSTQPTTTPLNKTWTLYDPHWRAEITGEVESRYSCFARYAYVIPQMSEGELRWRSMLDTLGLRASPKNIWAIIPWSFVIDWFVNVSNALDTLDDGWVRPEISVSEAYFSWSWKYSATLRLYPQSGWTGAGSKVADIVGTRYLRTLGVPDFTVKTPDLDADKIRLLASLVGSKVL